MLFGPEASILGDRLADLGELGGDVLDEGPGRMAAVLVGGELQLASERIAAGAAVQLLEAPAPGAGIARDLDQPYGLPGARATADLNQLRHQADLAG
jgi:hypothetical protein